MVGRIIREAGFGLRLKTGLKEIVGDSDGRACAVVTDADERLECQLVGLTAGVSPNIDLLEDTTIETGRGVLVDWSLRTNVPDVLAAGDCAEIVTDGDSRNLVQQVWYTGKRQARVAARVLAGMEAVYDPGVWYNSAKFLDLEYHTYGQVNLDVPDEQNLYWEHPDGLHSIRIVHLQDRVIGFNTMGVRFRHRVCEAWIAERRPLEYVLDHLEEANFDPEFHRRFEAHVANQFKESLV
jgi:NADPH-dependent 2,4-dienoyl-CoA reductase/sulfur reductase-like enzyme